MPPATRKRKLEQAVEDTPAPAGVTKKHKAIYLPTPNTTTTAKAQARPKRAARTGKEPQSKPLISRTIEKNNSKSQEEEVAVPDQPPAQVHFPPHVPPAGRTRRANSEPIPKLRRPREIDRVEDWVQTQLTEQNLADHNKWQDALEDMTKALDLFRKDSPSALPTKDTPKSAGKAPSKRKLSYPQATLQLDDLGIHNDGRKSLYPDINHAQTDQSGLSKPAALQALCDKLLHVPKGTNKDGHSSNNCPTSQIAVKKQRHAAKSLEDKAIELLENYLGYQDEGMDDSVLGTVKGEKGIARERNLLWRKDSVPVPDAVTPRLQIQLQLSGIPPTPKPDFTYGYADSSFNKTQLKSLRLLKEISITRQEPHLPYWAQEWKSQVGGGNMEQAVTQGRRDGAAAVATL